MRTVGVRELKEHTSEILKAVTEGGETLEVTMRGRPVARIVPIEKIDRENAVREFLEHTRELQRRIAEKWPELKKHLGEELLLGMSLTKVLEFCKSSRKGIHRSMRYHHDSRH